MGFGRVEKMTHFLLKGQVDVFVLKNRKVQPVQIQCLGGGFEKKHMFSPTIFGGDVLQFDLSIWIFNGRVQKPNQLVN